jgi:hypothetical protein
MAYVGCIAGALLVEEYRRWLEEAGFAAVQIVDTGKDLNAYAQVDSPSGCCAPAASCCAGTTVHEGLGDVLRKYNVNDYAASVQVYALKGAE